MKTSGNPGDQTYRFRFASPFMGGVEVIAAEVVGVVGERGSGNRPVWDRVQSFPNGRSCDGKSAIAKKS
jgi:hypothetical protein